MNLLEKWKFGKFLNALSISKIDTLSGIEFEEFVADLFCYLGYKATLTKSSGDNGIDIVVNNNKYSIGVQTKLYYNHNVSNKAIQEVFSGKNYYKTDYALVVTNWKYSAPARNLAKELKVAIIDRNDLTKMLNNSLKDNKKFIKNIINSIKE